MCRRLFVMVLLCLSTVCFAHSQTSGTATKNCTPPKPKRTQDPPHDDFKNNLGVVTLAVFVDEKGSVSSARIVDSSGSDNFDRDALDAVRQWKFKPSLCEGKPTPAHIAVQFDPKIKIVPGPAPVTVPSPARR